MWGTQGWNQWALQPSMFQNVPHEEIDWAALAKQWIQMQHVPPADGGSSVPMAIHAPPPPPPPPPPAVVPGDFQNDVPVPPPFSKPPLLEDPYNRIVPSDMNRSPLPVSEAGDSSFQVRQSDGAYWTNQEWERSAAHDIDERLWNTSPMDPMAAGQMSKETFDYGHLPDNPPLQMHTVDYNHVSDQFAFNQVYTPENQYDVYWSQVGAAAAAAVPATVAPTFLKKDRIGGSVQADEDISHIDAAKRKQLPAWIREGLEKMEQDRLKRLEKERAEKEKAEKMKVKKKSEESSTKGLNLLHSGEYDKSPPTMPLKSKFDSDSEGEDEIEEQDLPVEEAPASPVEDHRTEEEKYQELMLKVRRMLTEILLEVTNAEMLAIAKEVYQKARLKAPARQLAMPSALPSVATGLRGLASYGSHSDESESEDEDAAGNTDSDEELYRKIKEKQKSFAIKEKKIIAELDREEAELREKRLAKAKAEIQLLNRAEKKTEAHMSNTKSNTENEDDVAHSEINNSSPVSRTTVHIPFLTDNDDLSSPSVQEVLPKSPVVQATDSVEDNSPDEGNSENQVNAVEDSEDNPEELENSSALNGSDSDGNNSGKQNDNEDDEIQVVENHSEENDIEVVKEKLSKSLSENTKGSARKTKSTSRSEKPRTKKKRSRSKGSDSSGNKNSRTSSRKRSKRKRSSSKSSRRKKRESSTASSSSSSSSSSISTSSSSYRSTSGSKERHKSRRDSRYRTDVRRSNSYERHRTSRRDSRSRKRSHSRSPARSGQRRRRSTSRSSYHNSNKVRHWDSYSSDSRRALPKSERHYSSRSRSRSPDSYRKGRKDYKRSRSRSRSRTPKKYKKRSRSLSSESESSNKRFSARRRYR